MTTWPNVRPYANLDEGQMTVMRKPTRFLVESPWKESSFEKPYLEKNPREMQFAFPKLEISFPDLEWPDHKGLPPYGEEYIKKTIKFAFPKCDTRPTEVLLDGALADSRAVARFDIPPLLPNDGGFEWSIEVSPTVSPSVLEISIKSEDKKGLSAELSILLRECVENLPEEVTVTVLAHSKTKLLAETQKYAQLPQIFNAFSKGPLDTFTEVLPNEVNGRITKNKQAVAAYLNQNNQPPNFGNTAIPPKEPPSLGNAERYFGNRDFNCGTLLIELICCPAIPPLTWDDVNNPTELVPNNAYNFYILGGRSPFIWTVTGNGFTWEQGETTGRENVLTVASDACGAAKLTVRDDCYEDGQAEIYTYVKVPSSGAWYTCGTYNYPRTGDADLTAHSYLLFYNDTFTITNGYWCCKSPDPEAPQIVSTIMNCDAQDDYGIFEVLGWAIGDCNPDDYEDFPCNCSGEGAKTEMFICNGPAYHTAQVWVCS